VTEDPLPLLTWASHTNESLTCIAAALDQLALEYPVESDQKVITQAKAQTAYFLDSSAE
jgi:hypothetical protein